MTSSILSHPRFGGAERSRLLFAAGLIVIALGAVKVAIRYYGFERLDLDTLFTSGIGAFIFIVAFLLSGLLQDDREAGNIPADLRISMDVAAKPPSTDKGA